MTRYIVGTMVAAVWMTQAPALRAQERVIPLDTVRVLAGSRAASELVAGTRGVEVVTAEQIRRMPASSVAEVLQWALGVDVMPRSPALADVSIRGSSYEQVLVLVDGVRVSDAQTGHFDLNLAVPLDQVERIEVLRGPAATLHGADAVGGVIHVVTRQGASDTRVRAEGGSFGAAALAASHGFGVAAARADVAAEVRRADGHRPGTDHRAATARAALSAPLAGRTLTADVAHAARDFGADGFYGPFPSYEETRATTATLALRAAPERRWALEPLVGLRRHTDHFVLRREDPSYYQNRHETLQWGGELVGRYAVSPALRLAAGVEGYRDRLRSRSLGDREEGRAAALVEVAAGRVGRATGSAGVRADWHEPLGTSWSPSAAAAWWPAEGVRLRGSVGRAFRAPTWTERFYRDPANIGDPELSPERAWSGEVGVGLAPLAGVRVGVAVFQRDARDLIDWARQDGAATDPWRTRNVEEARFRGVEAEAGGAAPLGLRWAASGTWLSVRTSAAPGFTSKYALRPLVETLSLQLSRAVAAGVDVGVRGQRARRAGEDAYLRVDARAAYPLGPLRLRVDLQNLLDERYPDITGLDAPGRALLVGVEWMGR